MKILYISQYFPPEIGAPAARASELARHWTNEGHNVTVLTGFPNHPDGIVPPEYRSLRRRIFAREFHGGIKVVRTWLLPFPNRKPHERILNHTSFFASAAFSGMFLSRPDIVIGTSPQMLVALAGWWVAKCKGAPFIFEVRDLWPESLTAVGLGSRKSLLYRTLGKIAGFLYRHSDHIAVVSPAFKEHLVRHWNVQPEKISIIPNGVEAELFSPRNADPLLRAQLGINAGNTKGNQFVVSYIGTIGMAHGLETLIEAAASLQTSAPNVIFLLVGEGAEREKICALAESRGLKNIRFVGPQPRERIPAYINASDACMVLLKKSEIFQTVIPTKMLEFMSCARPVILGVEGQARKIVESAAAGIWIAPESATQLTKAILQLEANRYLGKQLGENGRKYILENLSRRQTAINYAALLEQLTAKRSPLYATNHLTQAINMND